MTDLPDIGALSMAERRHEPFCTNSSLGKGFVIDVAI